MLHCNPPCFLHPSTAVATVRTHVRHTRQSTRTGRQTRDGSDKAPSRRSSTSSASTRPSTATRLLSVTSAKRSGLASSSTVHAHLANLEKIGLLRRDPSKPRAIELLDRAVGSAVDSVRGIVRAEGLPVLGSVAAGQPMLAEENIEEYVSVPGVGRRGGRRVRAADSWRLDEGSWHPGRRFCRRASAGNGDGMATSWWHFSGRRQPSSASSANRTTFACSRRTTMEPIRSKEVKVLGRVVGLLRRVKRACSCRRCWRQERLMLKELEQAFT